MLFHSLSADLSFFYQHSSGGTPKLSPLMGRVLLGGHCPVYEHDGQSSSYNRREQSDGQFTPNFSSPERLLLRWRKLLKTTRTNLKIDGCFLSLSYSTYCFCQGLYLLSHEQGWRYCAPLLIILLWYYGRTRETVEHWTI
jgi:hypothetical protein